MLSPITVCSAPCRRNNSFTFNTLLISHFGMNTLAKTLRIRPFRFKTLGPEYGGGMGYPLTPSVKIGTLRRFRVFRERVCLKARTFGFGTAPVCEPATPSFPSIDWGSHKDGLCGPERIRNGVMQAQQEMLAGTSHRRPSQTMSRKEVKRKV
jgi:hypothetical protein